MKQISVSDIIELPVQERIQLVEDIWDSVAAIPNAVTIPEWQKKKLDKRLESYHANPSVGSPGIEVRRRILGEESRYIT